MYDSIVIGAGVVGCAVARELALYTKSVCVLESKIDISEGTSKANSGIVHAGYDAVPGTQKALYNVLGNQRFDVLKEELSVSFKRIGSLVLCFSNEQRPQLDALKRRGDENGVPDLRIVEKEELKCIEPHVSDNAICALYAPTGGIVCPYGLCEALAENACANGARFYFEQEVQSIKQIDGGFAVYTPDNCYQGKTVVNAAGVYTDRIADMAGGKTCSIHPRRGEYCVMDKRAGSLIQHTLFQLPGPMGKGVLVTPSVDGNLLIGPTAVDTADKEDTDTTQQGLHYVLETAGLSVDHLPVDQIITSFAGLRAHPDDDEFHVGEDQIVPNLFHAAGIESPGLTAAPAIGVVLCDHIVQKLQLKLRTDAKRMRKGIERFANMTADQRINAIACNSAYGNIVCRCETVTEAEVVDAIHRAPGAKTLDGVKRRTRCGMGRCQGGFCMPRISAILMRELGLSMEEITKKGGCSVVVTGPIKQEEPCKR